MKSRFAALFMALLLAVYLVLVGQRAVMFVLTGEPIGIAIGVALIVLPIVGAWALVRELMFGFRTEQLVGRLEREGELPVDDLPKKASGRPLREAADEEFPVYRDEVERDESDWRAWFRLGLAYDASGDRRRARKAIRTAIALEQSQRRAKTA
ncbi:tetratricopeptide repeat protein [Herbiconiux solani]|uniref:tetratricopeptide repeat protein n=1 Tax=Herbiconiux solani TaxID=661329 RepID=UPI00082444E5|nr:tetratricopeptide repeat protein [Herbiconiux solani]